MDYVSAGDFGRDRLSQFHAEASEWRLAQRAATGERARAPRAVRLTGLVTDIARYAVGAASAVAALFFFTAG